MVDAERAHDDCRCDALPVQAKRLWPILPAVHDDDGAFLDPVDCRVSRTRAPPGASLRPVIALSPGPKADGAARVPPPRVGPNPST